VTLPPVVTSGALLCVEEHDEARFDVVSKGDGWKFRRHELIWAFPETSPAPGIQCVVRVGTDRLFPGTLARHEGGDQWTVRFVGGRERAFALSAITITEPTPPAVEPTLTGHAFRTMCAPLHGCDRMGNCLARLGKGKRLLHGLSVVLEGAPHDPTETHDNAIRDLLREFLAKPAECNHMTTRLKGSHTHTLLKEIERDEGVTAVSCAFDEKLPNTLTVADLARRPDDYEQRLAEHLEVKRQHVETKRRKAEAGLSAFAVQQLDPVARARMADDESMQNDREEKAWDSMFS